MKKASGGSYVWIVRVPTTERSVRMSSYNVIHNAGDVPVKMWTKGVPVEDDAKAQLMRTARLPFIHKWVAAMPDVHVGMGATVGSVIPTNGAVIPAAVGVDLGCGMMAVQTSLRAEDLPETLDNIRGRVEHAVPHGRSDNGGANDVGGWRGKAPTSVQHSWSALSVGFTSLVSRHPKIAKCNNLDHLGTLGTGNHFIELCLDEQDRVWVMLHSGSRGVGNRIGSHFIRLAKEDMKRWFINLPDKDLSYFPEGTEHFSEYCKAVGWAQDYARLNREIMMAAVLDVLRKSPELPPFEQLDTAVNCHHNYIANERHYGERVWVTRKGAVRAGLGDLGIIPGSMGAKSYIVRGKGNRESFCSCSHGAGRKMSRTEARKTFTVEDHQRATEGISCRKDEGVLDETPAAYKDIDDVMAAQSDLVDVVHTLRQVMCVKG